ncbi:MAG: lysophospholipid acyltransferase family protein, partial [Nitrospinales bacterium]
PSKDGDLLANLARRMGYSVVRGSTYKSPIAAGRSLIKILRKNQGIIVVADGSRGPRHKAQAGSLQLAGIAGAPVIPMAYGARRKIEFNSWDRFILPLPFTRITLNFGGPIHVPRNADDRAIKKKQAELEESLKRIDLARILHEEKD